LLGYRASILIELLPLWQVATLLAGVVTAIPTFEWV